MELYANDAASTLSADCTAGATTLSITDVSTFPATGNFRIKIGTEIILVCGVSGSTFTSCLRGQEGTTAASHTNGDAVTHIVTKQSLRQFWPGYGRELIAPPTTSWSWENQQGASVSNWGWGLTLTDPTQNQYIWYYRAAPTPPYNIYMVVRPLVGCAQTDRFGFAWRANDGKYSSYLLGGDSYWHGYKFTNSTTYAGSEYTLTNDNYPRQWDMMYLKASDDGTTNRVFSMSVDGVNWRTVHSVARTDYLTPTGVGFHLYTATSGRVSQLSLISWEEA